VVRYDEYTALVVVDVQNDFADPAGSLFVQGGDVCVHVCNREIADALSAGATVVYTQDWHPTATPHFADQGGVWPVHCVRDTWGAELHPELVVAGDTLLKGTGGEDGYSGFTMRNPVTETTASTGLHEVLQSRSVERVVVVGLALDVCVKATALDAVALGYPCAVVRAASAPVDLQPGDGERAVAEMTAAGITVID